ncbi:MAG TPA: hypothetical protein PKG90_00410 [Chitinophagaceae bacterium]|nr:hypothetical protein [Chitinophagaceae bacterium]HNU13149.1 hypothetical protein [Chitinophagaceae bacterium]
MKKKFFVTLSAVLMGVTIINAQKAQFGKEKFQPLKTNKLSFTPYTISDFSKTDKTKTVKDLITLPNKKKVTLENYLKTINHIEKNLSDIGISRNRTEQLVVASKYKPVTGTQATISPAGVKKAPLMSKTTVNNRFKLANTGLSEKALAMEKLKDQLSDKMLPDADQLPNEPFNSEQEFNLPEFTVADYGVKVKASYKQKGIIDPFSLSGNRLQADSLKKLIKNTANEFTIGFNVHISTDLPGVGNFPVYKLESEFTSKANKDQKHKSKAKLQVLERVLLNENSTPSADNYSYNQDAIYNTKQKLGAADIFNYGLNVVLPVDMYLMSTGVGAEFDMSISRTGVGGTISPIITQSIILETSASETVGPVADMLNFDVLDIGVGGELRLLQGGLDFGGNAGLAVSNGGLKFINDTYNAVSLKMLKGRLYTFYTYPKFTCNNIFLQGLDSKCWVVRRVENDFFETGSFIELEQVLADEFKGKNLKWK